MAQITRKQVRGVQQELKNERLAVESRQLDELRNIRSAYFAGVDPRRRRELADAGMVSEDREAMANLSPHPIHREWPKDGTGFVFTPYLDDTRKD